MTRDDEGSVLPLVIGCVVLVVALVAVVTDTSALWLRRRALQDTVDGAALAGAQSVDLAAVYAGGARGDLRLDPAGARRSVTAYVRSSPAVAGMGTVRVTSVTASGSVVTVRARSTVQLPFTTFLTGGAVPVTAEAAAVLRVP